MKAAVVQLAPAPNVDANIGRAAALLKEAAARGAALAVLPEFFAYGYDALPWEEVAEGPVGPTTAVLAEAARESGILAVAARPARLRGGIASQAVAVGPGGVLARYEKRFLWEGERDRLAPGNVPVQRMTPLGLAGFLVCYDLEFPEAARSYLAPGARVLLAPAAFSTRSIWDVATRARALENGMFLLAANLAGPRFCGRSRIVAPDGEILAEVENGEGVAVAEVDWDAYAPWREAHAYRRDLAGR